MNSEAVIEVSDLRRTFGNRAVIDNVSFSIHRGETLVIMGGSGCGKSTLLRHIIGVMKPSSGSVKIFGQEITTMNEREMADVRRRFGMLFQSGALLNSLLLFGISAYILYEAYGRFRDPPEVSSVPLLVVASIGLGVNIFGAYMLSRGASESLNVRGAFLEVAGDLLGSVGAIIAGIILLTTGWRYADPLFAAGVGLFILPRTWLLLRSALDVLFEGTPAHIELQDVQSEIRAQRGVESVHDLHVWTVTSGFVALSGHVQVRDGVDRDALLVSLRSALASRFDIDHVTIQVEDERLSAQLEQACFPEAAPWDGQPGNSQPAERSASPR